MIKHRDSFLRSGHGGLIRSPHGQFDDIERRGRPIDYQLMVIPIIDESVYHVETWPPEVGYVGIPPDEDPLPGEERYDEDLTIWNVRKSENHNVVAYVIQIKGSREVEALTPYGIGWPHQYIGLGAMGRGDAGILHPDAEIEGGIEHALRLYYADQIIRGIIFVNDLSGSMDDAFVPPWEEGARIFITDIVDYLHGRGKLHEDVELWSVGITNERWLRWITDATAFYYNEEPWPDDDYVEWPRGWPPGPP